MSKAKATPTRDELIQLVRGAHRIARSGYEAMIDDETATEFAISQMAVALVQVAARKYSPEALTEVLIENS